jgi:hypothetical protein
MVLISVMIILSNENQTVNQKIIDAVALTDMPSLSLQALNWDESLTNFHPNGHAFATLQAQNWGERLTYFHPKYPT